jgi:hypothetical protein
MLEHSVKLCPYRLCGGVNNMDFRIQGATIKIKKMY